MSAIMDMWRLSNEVKEITGGMKYSAPTDKVRLANLLEHIGFVIRETHQELATGQVLATPTDVAALSEELYFKLAVLAREEHTFSAAQNFLRLKRSELFSNLITHDGVDLAQLRLLEETAINFIQSSRNLKMFNQTSSF
ncbi:MAG: hypothetical protein KF775_09145 [Cyclobacteriaceae bacterium]|nr:hypothetical protein [Cyclobacteriaceae bacterium]